jgi:hypothetical protein
MTNPKQMRMSETETTPRPTLSVLPEEPIEDLTDGLVEELAVTTTINEMFAEFLAYLNDTFEDLKFTSEEANPVRTHLHLVSAEEDVVQRTLELQGRLLETLAKSSEEIPTTGLQLTRQVIANDEAEED